MDEENEKTENQEELDQGFSTADRWIIGIGACLVGAVLVLLMTAGDDLKSTNHTTSADRMAEHDEDIDFSDAEPGFVTPQKAAEQREKEEQSEPVFGADDAHHAVDFGSDYEQEIQQVGEEYADRDIQDLNDIMGDSFPEEVDLEKIRREGIDDIDRAQFAPAEAREYLED